MMKKVWLKTVTAILAASCLAGCSTGAKEGAASSEAAAPSEANALEGTEGKAEDVAADGEEKELEDEEGSKEEKGEESAVDGEAETILVAAAASLKNAYEEELIPMFEAQYPNITVEGTYDSSGKLQTQIEEGLEADVFMSAAVKQMDALEEEGLIASETKVDLLENKIVLIVPSGSDLGLASFEDMVKAESVALGDPASVPAGQYAQEALTSLGIWEEIQAKASFGTNVTEVLNQVAAASADAGIVYATDAASMAGQVEVVAEAPEGSLSQKVIYPLAVVKGSAHPDSAGKFVAFLQTPEAMAVFEAYGFTAGN